MMSVEKTDAEAENIVGHYQRHAELWDRERGRELTEKEWLDRFLTAVPAGSRLLDLGCGGGEPIAKYLIERGYRVEGIDSSDPLIALCRRRFENHLWETADMRSLALGRRFAGIVARDSFFHLTPGDQRKMFPIFRDHTITGAPLMFTSGPEFGVAIGSFAGEALYHASLDPAEYRQLLADNGFKVVDYVAEDPSCGLHTVWLAQRF